ncbi:MAG: deoxyguanosinetriphosphate triphosphohydrolase [Candidatus Omnitrophica bacterium]|nr:deoxyguanosinetriphosphate triphosphohydrolase [Candidatus Omnitrophota bacterium]
MLTRKQLEQREQLTLAPYAVKSRNTRGRVYEEPEHDYRSIYQRDADRIIYSTAFRRLEYKTQVFVNHEGDYYRTRLTHTLEVAQIARTIARTLRLNEELVQAIALAHDLGHTPFGHAGEDALARLMAGHGGFEHNSHGLRVVELLEQRYPDFPGLNLSFEVREGVAKHRTSFDRMPAAPDIDHGPPSLEAQTVDLADEIAYDNHDLDDGLKSGLIEEKDLASIPLWRAVEKKIKKQHPSIDYEMKKYQIVRTLIHTQVTDCVLATEKALTRNRIRDVERVRAMDKKLVGFSAPMAAMRRPLREFLLNKLYRHYRVVRMSDKAARFIESLFKVYANKPEQLPPHAAARLKEEDKYRVICDYIAGMTDRYALDEYKKFFEPYERV